MLTRITCKAVKTGFFLCVSNKIKVSVIIVTFVLVESLWFLSVANKIVNHAYFEYANV